MSLYADFHTVALVVYEHGSEAEQAALQRLARAAFGNTDQGAGITRNQIQNVLDHLFKTNAYLDYKEAGILAVLETGIENGEFDGSQESAAAYLNRAGYQL
jgi:hypothetical protein